MAKHASPNPDQTIGPVTEALTARSDQLQRILSVVPTDWAMGYNAALWDIGQDLGLLDEKGHITDGSF
jgi:hypothetical protein